MIRTRRCSLTSQILTCNHSTTKCTTRVPSIDGVRPQYPSSWHHCNRIWDVVRATVVSQRTSTLTCPKIISGTWASATRAQRFGWETARVSTNTPSEVSTAVRPLREPWSLRIVKRYRRTSQPLESIDTSKSKKGSPKRTPRLWHSSRSWRIKPKRESFTWKKTKKSWKSTDLRKLRARLRFLKIRFRLQPRSQNHTRNETRTSVNDRKAYTPSKMTSEKQNRCCCLVNTQVMTMTNIATWQVPFAPIFLNEITVSLRPRSKKLTLRRGMTARTNT